MAQSPLAPLTMLWAGVMPRRGELLVAKRLMQKFWQGHVYDWDQGRWIYLFDEGLIDRATADAWADEIWPPEVEEDEGEDD